MISRLLSDQAQRTPDAVALEAPGRRPLTYAALYRQVEAMTADLRRLGAGQGDPVALVLPNGPDMALAMLALVSGATAAPLNPGYRAAEFEFYLKDLRPKALVLRRGQESAARQVAAEQGLPIWELAPGADAEGWAMHLEGAPEEAGAAAESTGAGVAALMLHTSGTTSRPKLVVLTQANLCASARSIAASLALGPGDRCLNVMPLFHIHGLVGVMLASLCAGASVVCTPGFQAGPFLEWLDEFRPSWYSAVPTMHQALLIQAASRAELIARRPLRFIRSCSAALPLKVMAELEATFQVPVIEAYGMTEASHQMTTNPLPPLPRKPGSVGLPAGLAVTILDGDGEPLPVGAIGEVAIRGESVTPGYANNPAANEAAFTNGWFRTGDQGYLDEDRYLFLTGRTKEIINRGGEKISPREVDDVLLEHPAIEQAVAFAVPHPTLGQDVGAAVVVRAGMAVTEEEVRAFASARLADFKVPRLVRFVQEIPKGATGKIQRIGIAEKLGLTGAAVKAPAEFVAPSTPMEEMLAEIWRDLLRVERVGCRDDFFLLGGDSLLAAAMIVRIAQVRAIDPDQVQLSKTPTIEALAGQLERMAAAGS